MGENERSVPAPAQAAKFLFRKRVKNLIHFRYPARDRTVNARFRLEQLRQISDKQRIDRRRRCVVSEFELEDVVEENSASQGDRLNAIRQPVEPNFIPPAPILA
ncbi:MAG: hypothetical protein IPJ30_12850 [Acidobacteria bacterium]|nr:hypothetical protein [Acidobacteriota bacterium]